MEYGVYGVLIMKYPKPYSIYLRGTIGFRVLGIRVIAQSRYYFYLSVPSVGFLADKIPFSLLEFEPEGSALAVKVEVLGFTGQHLGS